MSTFDDEDDNEDTLISDTPVPADVYAWAIISEGPSQETFPHALYEAAIQYLIHYLALPKEKEQ